LIARGLVSSLDFCGKGGFLFRIQQRDPANLIKVFAHPSINTLRRSPHKMKFLVGLFRAVSCRMFPP
jgi:hypothetical protein